VFKSFKIITKVKKVLTQKVKTQINGGEMTKKLLKMIQKKK
jgi:hypothetical protein